MILKNRIAQIIIINHLL